MDKIKALAVASLVAVAAYAIWAGVICLLWNIWLADFFGLPHITFGIAVALKTLCDILFSNVLSSQSDTK